MCSHLVMPHINVDILDRGQQWLEIFMDIYKLNRRSPIVCLPGRSELILYEFYPIFKMCFYDEPLCFMYCCFNSTTNVGVSIRVMLLFVLPSFTGWSQSFRALFLHPKVLFTSHLLTFNSMSLSIWSWSTWES